MFVLSAKRVRRRQTAFGTFVIWKYATRFIQRRISQHHRRLRKVNEENTLWCCRSRNAHNAHCKYAIRFGSSFLFFIYSNSRHTDGIVAIDNMCVQYDTIFLHWSVLHVLTARCSIVLCVIFWVCNSYFSSHSFQSKHNSNDKTLSYVDNSYLRSNVRIEIVDLRYELVLPTNKLGCIFRSIQHLCSWMIRIFKRIIKFRQI